MLLEAATKLRAGFPALSVLIAGEEVPGQEAYANRLRDLQTRLDLN